MRVLRYLDPLLRAALSLVVAIGLLGIVLGRLPDASRIASIWSAYALIAVAGCVAFRSAVVARPGRFAVALVVVTSAVLASARAGIELLVLITITNAIAAALFASSFRWRPSDVSDSRGSTASTRATLRAGTLAALGMLLPPLVATIAAEIDEVRRRDLVDALAATDSARQPRGDRRFPDFDVSRARDAESERDWAVMERCGGKPLARGPDLWSIVHRPIDLLALLDGVGADEDREHFRSGVASINSAWRLKGVQLCIGTGLCQRRWFDYVMQPARDRDWERIRSSGETLPSSPAINADLARDYACGLGRRVGDHQITETP